MDSHANTIRQPEARMMIKAEQRKIRSFTFENIDMPMKVPSPTAGSASARYRTSSKPIAWGYKQ
jgi:hypothetical protein